MAQAGSGSGAGVRQGLVQQHCRTARRGTVTGQRHTAQQHTALVLALALAKVCTGGALYGERTGHVPLGKSSSVAASKPGYQIE